MVSSFGSVFGYWQLALLLPFAFGLIFVLISLRFESRRSNVISKFLIHKSRLDKVEGIAHSDMSTKITEYVLANFSETEKASLVSEGFI